MMEELKGCFYKPWLKGAHLFRSQSTMSYRIYFKSPLAAVDDKGWYFREDFELPDVSLSLSVKHRFREWLDKNIDAHVMGPAITPPVIPPS